MKDHPKIYDSNDLNYDFVKGDKYVIRRTCFRRKQLFKVCCSSFFLQNLNNFGKLGGFDLLLKKVAERDDPISFKELH